MMRWLMALVLAAVVAPTSHARLGASLTDAQSGAEISGTVVLADSPSTPARHVRVMITGPDVSNMITDDSGRFTFTGLRAGKYILSGSKPGYAAATYGSASAYDEPLQIAVAPGQRVTNLQLPLQRGSVITGTVLDREGAPVAGAEVSLGATLIEGGRMLPTVTVRSADDGSYRLFGLSAGEFIVSASLEKARTYYPSSSTASGAAPIAIGAREERPGIDIVLQPNGNTTISGTIVASDGQPASGVTLGLSVMTNARVASPVTALDDIDQNIGSGTFTLKNVPPGTYEILAERGRRSATAKGRGADEFEAGAITVTVGGQPTEGLSIVLSPGTTVSGRVSLDMSGSEHDLPDLRLIDDEARFLRTASTSVDDDGTWMISGVMPGRYRLASAPAEPGAAARKIRSATLNGRDVIDAPFEVGADPVKGIAVTITDKLGSVRGTLTDSAGVPATNFRIIVFPADRTQWVRLSLASHTQAPDSNGDWIIPNLLLGEYRVAAIAGRGIVSLTPELLEQLAAASTTASVTANNVVVVNLRVGG